ncbi:IclR family transcriptional regulator [Tersicoccus sp. Bi-70]|uniref:IclR family transcriptional regulator n=1 Tax=Tersicoccus sp. Bi-70 TaxID=1897634 RepID=UPI0009774500|nr:IclR family transcriptional regulator [Tersicoccus sp. Bi-70]OMH32345.1 IclR family transcriptional regulator [Tersicoccus sp. Bi-70]
MSQSLLRALDLLERLANGPAGLDELAAAASVHKTTVMRLLHALEERRFVVRDETQRYRLGSQLFALAAVALDQREVIGIARPHLARFNQSTGHTVHLAALEGDDVVYIDKLESRHPVRMYSRVGLTAALHAAAVAKVLLADLPPARQRAIADGIDYVPLTEHTITTPEGLLAELATVARQGWALDGSEHEAFVHCVAAPIHDARGRVIAAASCSVPVVLLDRPGLLDLVPELVACTDAVSADLGWTRPPTTPTQNERTPS